MTKTKQEWIYEVWGPSAEWGDGVGVIAVASCEEDARAILEQEREDEQEYGPRSWRTVDDCGSIEPVPVEEVLRDNPKAQEIYEKEGLEGLVEYLNGLLS